MLTAGERWRGNFASHAGQHADVRVPQVEGLTRDERSALGRSLATFQLGESGTGEHLLAAARAAPADDGYVAALEAFVKEEQEHARLLALVLEAIDHPLLTSHWSDRAFVFIRRFKSLRTEVLALLVAELIALRYYSALRDGIDSPPLAAIFGRIHADEVRHVEFHADTLPPHILRWHRPVRRMVRVLWTTLVAGTSVVVAIDHRAALRLAGVGSREFLTDVWRLRAELDQRLFG